MPRPWTGAGSCFRLARRGKGGAQVVDQRAEVGGVGRGAEQYEVRARQIGDGAQIPQVATVPAVEVVDRVEGDHHAAQPLQGCTPLRAEGVGGVLQGDQDEREAGEVVEPSDAPVAQPDPALRGERADRRSAAVTQHTGAQRGERWGRGHLSCEEGRVAGFGRGDIAGVGDPAETDRGVRERGDVRASFTFVRVQQCVRSLATENEVQLPRQVGRVAQAAARALTEVRRHGVGRVAGQQDPADPPPGRDPRLEGVDQLADDPQVGPSSW